MMQHPSKRATNLPPFARRFLEVLQRERPDILKRGRFSEHENGWSLNFGEDRFGENRGVYIRADDTEATVGFGEWHTHFPMGHEEDEADETHFRNALHCALDLIDERLVVVRTNRIIELFTAKSPDDALRTWSRIPYATQIRSFLGTYNKDPQW